MSKPKHSKYLTFKEGTKGDVITSPFGVVVIVSKKVIKLASGRNLLKRQLRGLYKDIVRDNPETATLSGIIYTRKGIQNLSYTELKEEFERLFA